MTLSRGMAPGIIRPSAPAGGITVGTVGTAGSDANQPSYSFAAPTLDGGGAGLLALASWSVAFGDRNDDFSPGVAAFTLNSVAGTILWGYLQTTGVNRYVQCAGAWWASPTSGTLDFTVPTGTTAIAGAIHWLNVTGAAGTLGTLVREQFSTGTALPFQITPSTSNSLVVCFLGAYSGGKGPVTFDNGGLTLMTEVSGVGAGNLTHRVGYVIAPGASALDAGGDFTTGDTDRIGGMAAEILAT